ncbi:MAG: hypothetical protein GX543_14200 [Gordonia sp.]|nr:hypothetical protein [Gordonia sp. (in: high G+C Gram-positive bacteria)]
MMVMSVAALCAATLVACGPDDSTADTVATVVVTETAGASTSPARPTSPTTAASSTMSDAKLTASFDNMAKGLSSPVGLALVPVGGGEVMSFGDQTPRVAWSTIKVPLAIAAERENGPSPAATDAIVMSDNAAAETLWSSLGTPTEASAAVTRVLREGGDKTSTVPSEKLRPEFSIFGQTTWALGDAATFSANLPCMPGTGNVLTLMEGVGGNQQWGLKAVPRRTTAVKGGWGPSLDGGYLVRQIGVLTLRDGRQVGVAMNAQTTAGSMEVGAEALSAVGRWIARHAASLPAGKCR